MNSYVISANLIDIIHQRIYPASLLIENGIIKQIQETEAAENNYILPGFIDAHVHIESSMLVPTTFAAMAVVHGTVATVSDPHEIANVTGLEGVQYMIDNSRQTPFKFFFGAPSCVPATNFESSGAILDASDVAKLLASPDIWYLSEMMNYPGVLHNDAEVMAKIAAAKKAGKPIDGHAPGLMGTDAQKYARAGITTDHECVSLPEALEKINAGMQILIREGSAAKNYEALAELIVTHPSSVMFCSDDKHPDELVLHHIDDLVRRSLKKGYNIFNVLAAACINPVRHYNLPVGQLRVGDPADFIVINNIEEFKILKTYINGIIVAESGKTLLPYTRPEIINNFHVQNRRAEEFRIKASSEEREIRVIEAIDGQLITNELKCKGKIQDGYLVSDTDNDILKIAVINRYKTDEPASIAFIKNFGLKKGAIASTVAHDCHNIIAVGVDDQSICRVVNSIIAAKGGISVTASEHDTTTMPLPIAGLMSDRDGFEVAAQYAELDKKAKELGSALKAPFMTLSFMALLVIPALKLSDKGLFNGNKFEFTPVEY